MATHALRSSPTLKCGPVAATTTARTDGVADSCGHGQGQVVPEVRAHGVAGLGAVEPEGGDVAVALDGEHRRLESCGLLPCHATLTP